MKIRKFVLKIFRQGEKYFLGTTVSAENFKFEKLNRFFTDNAWKAVGE